MEGNEEMASSNSSESDAPVVIEGDATDVTEASNEAADLEGKSEESDADLNSDNETSGAIADDDAPLDELLDAAEDEVAAIETAAVAAVPVAPVAASGPSTMNLLFGGLVAGAIGYGASYFGTQFDGASSFDGAALTESVSSQETQIATLASDVEAIKTTPASAPEELTAIEAQLTDMTTRVDDVSARLDTVASDVSSRFDDFSAQLATVEDSVSDTATDFGAQMATLNESATTLDERIKALEVQQPGGAEVAAINEELETFKAQLEETTASFEARVASADAQTAELETSANAQLETFQTALAAMTTAAEERVVDANARASEAELAAVAAAEEAEKQAEMAKAEAERQMALSDLQVALESGADYAPILERLENVPDVIAENAETGVPSIPVLQRDFPTAARAALSVSQVVPDDASAGDKLSAFFKRRTNARSLAPKDGSSADAILSRAEAELGSGNLDGALSELDALPDEAKTAMDAWLSSASTRAAVLEAAEQLTATN